MSGLFLKFIYVGASMIVHLWLLKLYMIGAFEGKHRHSVTHYQPDIGIGIYTFADSAHQKS